MVHKLTRTETGHHFIVVNNLNEDTEWASLKKFYKDAIDTDFEMWCGVYSLGYSKWITEEKEATFEPLIEELIEDNELQLTDSGAIIVLSESYGGIQWIAELENVDIYLTDYTSKTFITDNNESITVWETV